MAKRELSPDSMRELLQRHKELEREDYKYRENQSTIELNDMLKELQSLQDEEARIEANIKKNLKTVSAQRHALQKIIHNSKSESPKLPVTHKHHQETLNFVSDAINFVNKFVEVEKSVKPENDLDTAQLCQEINACGESVNQELGRSKTRVNQVGALMENTELIKNYILPCDHDDDDEDDDNDDQHLMG